MSLSSSLRTCWHNPRPLHSPGQPAPKAQVWLRPPLAVLVVRPRVKGTWECARPNATCVKRTW
jgi:hypothetical protein